jgi:hypothetical protein
MKMIRVRGIAAMLVLAAAGWWPSAAAAQAYGAGPLTETLADTEPLSGVFNWGLIKFAPGFTVDELGYDSNVFDEPSNPKSDFVFRGSPDVSVFSLLRFAKISAYAGSDMLYYKDYAQERSIGHEYRARVDMMLSRFHPFFGVGQTRHRTRPNGEIDVRADEQQEEMSAGLGFDLGPHQVVFMSASRFRTDFKNGLEDGIDLPTTLNHDSDTFSVGIRTAVTPITTLTVTGALMQDKFQSLRIRNNDLRQVTGALRIGSEAAINGVISMSYTDTKPVDPLVKPFRGMTAEGSLSYSFLEVGRFGFAINRGLQYSFDEAEAYYLENTFALYYTHRIRGELDFQVRGTKSIFDYGFREGVPARKDSLEAAGASIGYNLRNRTRVSLNYEVSRRRSPAFAERNYDRTRVYVSWLYAF